MVATNSMKKFIADIFKKMGYSIIKRNNGFKENYPDIKNEEFWNIYELCKPYTMTSLERMYALYASVEYVLVNNVKGDFIECGVWRGGSAMLIAKMLNNRNQTDRRIFLYDTFEGMPAPSPEDVDRLGNDAAVLLKQSEGDKETTIWCVADISDVQNNMKLTGFPTQNLIYIKGKVENTIPSNSPDGDIALLRLDTDWYESTKHELNHLFPKLVVSGVLIIDDYGHWQGCKKAVDDYLIENKIKIFFNRIDYSGRVGLKMD